MNEKEICFIMCVNNHEYMEEAVYYINHLHVPDGFQVSFLAVEDASSMTVGYNEGMKASDAKYKVYLHQDTFLTYPYFLDECIALFQSDARIGMIGLIGIPKMPPSGIMWDGKQYGKLYETHIYETIIRGNDLPDGKDYLEVEAVDGFLMVTQYDIPWREDIFDHWDFYDASQSMEFIKRGYMVVVPRMEKPWALHDCGFLNKDNYEKEREKYVREYLEECENPKIMKRKEVVFLPYKASMWDSLESVWRAADEDPESDTYVIPIPYFDKDKDGKVYAMHYEGDQFPEYVPITSYQEYSIEERHPDMIFIHNPYDEHNLITTVHPDYYSTKLRECTDELIYIPYFVLGEINPVDKQAVRGMAHFATVPGVVNAHKVIVQSENMKRAYVEALTEWAGEDSRPIWEKKILGLGSPKLDRIRNYKLDESELPTEWKKILYREDGSRRKVILYNNSVGSFLTYKEKMIEKIKKVLNIFHENREEIALLWRPHPLMESTIKATCPELWEPYQNIVKQYQEQGWGIYDDTADLDRAVALSDAYYGDGSSVVELFKVLGKPVMIQDVVW